MMAIVQIIGVVVSILKMLTGVSPGVISVVEGIATIVPEDLVGSADKVVAIVKQVLGLVGSVEPAVERALSDFLALFEGGATPTQEQLDALIDRIKTQSAEIQKL